MANKNSRSFHPYQKRIHRRRPAGPRTPHSPSCGERARL